MPRAANQFSFGHIASARHRATDSADGFSRVRRHPSMLRVATSATRARYALPANAFAVHDLHEVDVRGRVIDLTNLQWLRGADISGSRVEPQQMFRVPRSLLGEFLRAEQRRNAAVDSDIGGCGEPGLPATGADFGHDRRKRRRLQRQPLRSQGRRDDLLDFVVEPLFPSAVRARQQRRHSPVDAIARQQTIAMPGREAQLGGRSIDRRSMQPCLIENPVEFVRDAARSEPRLVRRRRRRRDRCSGLRSVRQIVLSVTSLAKNFTRLGL